jgi:hypothetical protein
MMDEHRDINIQDDAKKIQGDGRIADLLDLAAEKA